MALKKNSPNISDEMSLLNEVPAFLKRETSPINPRGGKDWIMFPNDMPLVSQILGSEPIMVQSEEAEEPLTITPDDIRTWLTGTVESGSIGFITGDVLYNELSKYVPKTTKVNGQALTGDIIITKGDIGLGNVDNTPDMNKPISNAVNNKFQELADTWGVDITQLKIDVNNIDQLLDKTVIEVNRLSEIIGELDTDFTGHLTDPDAHSNIRVNSMVDTTTDVKIPNVTAVRDFVTNYVSRLSEFTIPAYNNRYLYILNGANQQKISDTSLKNLLKMSTIYENIVTSPSQFPDPSTLTVGTIVRVGRFLGEIITDPYTSYSAKEGEILVFNGNTYEHFAYSENVHNFTILGSNDKLTLNLNDQAGTIGIDLPFVTNSTPGILSPADYEALISMNGLTKYGTPNSSWEIGYTTGDLIRLDKTSGGALDFIWNNPDNPIKTDAEGNRVPYYAAVTLGDLIIKGNVTQEGSSFISKAETVEVKDNTLLLNKGETGAGVTKGTAGVEIDRGTLPRYQFLFDESDDRFKVGSVGDLWPVMIRDEEADLTDGGILTWDATTKRAKTSFNIDDLSDTYLPLTAGTTKPLTGPLYITNGTQTVGLEIGKIDDPSYPNSQGFIFKVGSSNPLKLTSTLAEVWRLTVGSDIIAKASISLRGNGGGNRTISFTTEGGNGSAVIYSREHQKLVLDAWMQRDEYSGEIILQARNLYRRDRMKEVNYRVYDESNLDPSKFALAANYIPLAGNSKDTPITGHLYAQDVFDWGIYGMKIEGADGLPRTAHIQFNANQTGAMGSEPAKSNAYTEMGSIGEVWGPNTVSQLRVGYEDNLPVLKYRNNPGDGTSIKEYNIYHEGNLDVNSMVSGFLPLSAGPTKPLTDSLYIGDDIGGDFKVKEKGLCIRSKNYLDKVQVKLISETENKNWSISYARTTNSGSLMFEFNGIPIMSIESEDQKRLIVHYGNIQTRYVSMNGRIYMNHSITQANDIGTLILGNSLDEVRIATTRESDIVHATPSGSYKVYDERNLDTSTFALKTDLDNIDLSGYLPLSGGTMSGSIVLPKNPDEYTTDTIKGLLGEPGWLTTPSEMGNHILGYQQDLILLGNEQAMVTIGAKELSQVSMGDFSTQVNGRMVMSVNTSLDIGCNGTIKIGAPSVVDANNNKYWTAGNDGSGSGLDADLLDGRQGSEYALTSSLNSYLPLSAGESNKLTGTLWAPVGTPGGAGNFNVNVVAGSSTVSNAGIEVNAKGTSIGFGAHEDGNGYFWVGGNGTQEKGHFATINKTSRGMNFINRPMYNGSNLATVSDIPTSLPANGGTSTYLKVNDLRESDIAPVYGEKNIVGWFNNLGTPSTNWWSGIHVKGWQSDYGAWQLAGPSDSITPASDALWFRSGKDNAWNGWKRVAFINEVVTLNTTQTISGAKTFTSYAIFSAGSGISSDIRLKENLVILYNSEEVLQGIHGYRYKLKESGKDYAGLIAQEVQRVLPEAVVEGEDGFLTVDTYPIVAALVESNNIKTHRIEMLEKRLSELESKVGMLLSRI